uniref:WW-binding domain-containing protein n=1 Tax=Pyxicephalus adspersus TaxID=30357 RepID=A0AAV3A9V7_PYXAD|nr:TPA: hypothetical protein GDO54_008463 [Pyxicephalus adspersus]
MKRKCEAQPIVTVLPPSKRTLYSKRCNPDIVQVTLVRKRKMEPEKGPPVQVIARTSESCEKVLTAFPAATSSPPPCKKLRAEESPEWQHSQYKCQKDEAFPEYNSFQYWKTPLPDIDFSELSGKLCGVSTCIPSAPDVSEEMDN